MVRIHPVRPGPRKVDIVKPGTLDEFHAGLTDYLRWWNTTHIQQRLGNLSPDEYRAQTSAIA
jgi:putative transposase